MNNKALVVLSGGQDSTTCLYWAIDRFGPENVSALTYDYGQRHRQEIDCAKRIAAHCGVAHTILPINTFAALGGNALVDAAVPLADDACNDNDSDERNLPNTFVPGRNLVFLTFAAAYAWQHAIGNLVTGVAQTDYSGYPDCREETIAALENTIRLGMESELVIHTPLMHLSKGETVELVRDLGGLEAMTMTITCYNGLQPPCGACVACQLRAKGFAEAGIADPLLGV
jgi:7-cyano-7-deazaguanine synthase